VRIVISFVHSEQDDARLRLAPPNRASRDKTIHIRQPKVEAASAGQQTAQARARHVVIVNK
jgi:hypothetical protein